MLVSKEVFAGECVLIGFGSACWSACLAGTERREEHEVEEMRDGE